MDPAQASFWMQLLERGGVSLFLLIGTLFVVYQLGRCILSRIDRWGESIVAAHVELVRTTSRNVDENTQVAKQTQEMLTQVQSTTDQMRSCLCRLEQRLVDHR